MELTQQQAQALHLATSGKTLFLTGSAGTGKSVLLREIVHKLEETGKRVAVTASTGLAAVNIDGRTIHAFLGTGTCGSCEELREFAKTDTGRAVLHNCRSRLRETDVLVIDEISMVTGDFLDMADERLRQVREQPQLPLGGLQAIFVGDFMQLPPVVKDEQPHPRAHYAFQSDLWRDLAPQCVNLTKVFRQSEEAFYRALDGMRMGRFEEAHVRLFDGRVAASEEQLLELNPTRLYPTRKQVADVTHAMLHEREPLRPRRLFQYPAVLSPSLFPRAEWIKRFADHFIAVPDLELKQGIPVLINANVRPDEGIVNGTRGTVTTLGSAHVTVELEAPGGLRQISFNIHTDRWTWVYRGGDGRPLACIEQLPLMPACAITVHKSQGMSLDPVHAALAANFAEGQVYVALSRARRLDGLTLDRLLRPGDVKTNDVCRRFHEQVAA